ncbi:hypothetical protein OS188_05565 [Xanthomarina sp. F1114]|uniref:hypothetical protein n=1 Tax=Xanthomarina sp. F1114 TaxID=2996019 RepID=UPI00225E384A|nr:hypothetical protein [Xanthomarina sp. F1114]MCX7547420.1 hypothetical protein [Xanthomarina sp. F1114]
MKKLSLLILGVIIGALVTYYFFSNCETKTQVTIVAPKGLITSEEARVLDAAFDKRHALISDSIVRRPDNRSAWWSLKDMRDYLNYAENESKELGYTMDGVRVYLGAYPTDREVGYTTMFLVPTGVENISQGNSTLINMLPPGGGDIPGGGLNGGQPGMPPPANYPQ